MKTKILLILASCLMSTTANAANNYDPITCPTDLSTILLKFSGDKCLSKQTKCFYHTMTSFRVEGCTSGNCQSGCVWEEYVFGNGVGSSLGGCKCPSTSISECYESQSSTTYPYKCKSGCYGLAVYTGNSVSGCTKCPSNATCSGGNGSTFICNSGYYKNESFCLSCPSNASCSNNVIKCNNKYYKNGTICEQCPSSPDPSPAEGNKTHPGWSSNATSITGCYLGSGYPYTGSTGSYKFTNDCYYFKPSAGTVSPGTGTIVTFP